LKETVQKVMKAFKSEESHQKSSDWNTTRMDQVLVKNTVISREEIKPNLTKILYVKKKWTKSYNTSCSEETGLQYPPGT
jgi:hypothetical protein